MWGSSVGIVFYSKIPWFVPELYLKKMYQTWDPVQVASIPNINCCDLCLPEKVETTLTSREKAFSLGA